MKFRRNFFLLFVAFRTSWQRPPPRRIFIGIRRARAPWPSAEFMSHPPPTRSARLSTNPAGLTYLTSPTLDLSMSTVFARGSFSNSANNNCPMTTSPGVIPYGAFGMPIGNSRFSFGVGFAPDLASVSDWHYVDAPGICRSHLRNAGTKIGDSGGPRDGWPELRIQPQALGRRDRGRRLQLEHSASALHLPEPAGARGRENSARSAHLRHGLEHQRRRDV